MGVYIRVENLTKIIKNNTILKDINLNLEEGKIYGFRGKNGSGKTMLFRAICGLIRATEGQVVINNEVLGKDISFPREIGILIENPSFLNELTGYKNLEYLANIKKIIGNKEICSAIESVGLDSKDKRKYKKYSLGMKQRLGIAQAIMESPKIIILDEPTNALDTDGVILLNQILKEYKEKNHIILLANHDKEELENIADEIFLIENGKILKQSLTNSEV